MLPEVEEALKYWRELNSMKGYWAAFEARQFPEQLVVKVDVGYYHFCKGDPQKEHAIKTRYFYTYDGKVEYHDSPHV